MKEENKVRLMRYSLGCTLLFFGIGFASLMQHFYVFSGLGEWIQIILIIVIIMGLVSCLTWSAILIGRCETFIKNKGYIQNKEEVRKK